MKIIRSLMFAGVIILYSCVFVVQEQKVESRGSTLTFAMPANVYSVATGYLKQLVAEMLFIKTSVFLGGLKPGTNPKGYESELGNNFEVMTSIYPEFIDPYYFCHSFLPSISTEAAFKTSTILETGIAAYPNDLILRFLYASNFIMAMNEPLKGANAFTDAAKLPDAPPIFAHLAALLSAKGGDIAAGLISLKTMLAAEKDKVVRTRYEEEIFIFEKALDVQKAINHYTSEYGVAPTTLEQLVPKFITSIPDFKDSFVLVYNSPNLHLQRPDSEKNTESGVPFK
ncbi:MAG: hypothetical protein ACI8ZB_001027 [Desulforhopalus sp.]|jgi:hypothetical protein